MSTYFHPSTKKIVDSVCKDLPQSILIYGELGVGLSSVSQYICESLKIKPTILLPEKDDKIDIENGIVSVKLIRDLYDATKSKSAHTQVYIIDYAERMTLQAQNAFLKLLEEPNNSIHFILQSHSMTSLLPTIISRTQKLHIKPITRENTENLLNVLGVQDNKKRAQIIFMADGLPAEITRLADDNDYFNSRSLSVQNAKNMLSLSVYDKLVIINSQKDNRDLALLLILDMIKILKTNLKSHSQNQSINQIDKLLTAYQEISDNGNIRIALVKATL